MTDLRCLPPHLTIGLDLADRYSRLSNLDQSGIVVAAGKVANTVTALERTFQGRLPGQRFHDGWDRPSRGLSVDEFRKLL